MPTALLFQLELDVVDGLADRLDLLGLVVGDLDVELFLEFHDQLDDVQRVRADVFDEAGTARDLLLVDGEVFAHDIDDATFHGHATTLPQR